MATLAYQDELFLLSINVALDFAKIPEIPRQAHSCLLASGLTVAPRRAWFPRSLGLTCYTQGVTNWRQQLQAVGMAAMGLSLKSYPALISPCTRQAVSEPVACSCHHLSQQAFEDVPPPTLSPPPPAPFAKGARIEQSVAFPWNH